ncbi:MAG: cation:proton antiporter, partial [Thermoplasmata archaeon]
TPVFFLSLGLLVDVWTLNPNLLLFGAALVAVAFVSKLAGCGLMARASRMPSAESLAIGYSMIPRGEVGLIIALVAEQQGIIGPDLFAIIVIVMIVVTVLPAPLIRKALLRVRGRQVEAPPETPATSGAT